MAAALYISTQADTWVLTSGNNTALRQSKVQYSTPAKTATCDEDVLCRVRATRDLPGCVPFEVIEVVGPDRESKCSAGSRMLSAMLSTISITSYSCLPAVEIVTSALDNDSHILLSSPRQRVRDLAFIRSIEDVRRQTAQATTLQFRVSVYSRG